MIIIKNHKNTDFDQTIRAVLYTGDIKPLYALCKNRFFRKKQGDFYFSYLDRIRKLEIGHVYFMLSDASNGMIDESIYEWDFDTFSEMYLR